MSQAMRFRRSRVGVPSLLLVSLWCLMFAEKAFIGARPPRSHRELRAAAGVDVMERVDVQSKEELLKASESLQIELEAVESKLRRANAFKLPEATGLRSEAQSLLTRIKEVSDQLSALEAPEPETPQPEPEEEAATSGTDSGSQKAPLSERLSWEKFEAMSNEEKMELTQEIGPAFGVSVGIVAFVYWSITLPILLNAYRESTGEWPRFEELFSLSDGGRTAGAVAGILGLAALMKPLRIAAAIALTPWTADNVLPLIPWLNSGDKKDKPDKS